MPVEDRDVTSGDRALEKKIDAGAWGFVFLWVGVALLAHVGWGVGLIGVGVIALGAQAWRRTAGVKVDRFSVVVGALFVLFGIWNLFALRVDLVPLLFIAAGIALLVSARRGHRAPSIPPGPDAPAHPRA